MLMLLSIVAIAVLVVASPSRQPRRCGQVLIGSLCLLLGLRAGTMLAQASFANLFSNVAVAEETKVEETEAAESEGAETDVAETGAAETGAAETDVAETDVAETGAAETGAAEADVAETGAAETETAPVQPEVTSSLEFDELATLETEGSEEDSRSGAIERVASVKILDIERYPDWLNVPPGSTGFEFAGAAADDDVQFVLAESTPWATESECQRDLDESLREATNDYINKYLNSPRAAMLLRYSIDDIRAHLVKATFEERLFLERHGFSSRKAHALLGFDNVFRVDLDQRWSQIVAVVRLMQTGLGAGVVLALLGSMFGYFRFDTATRGYYTGRLQFAAAAAILVIAAVGVLLAQWIPGM